MLAPSNTTCRRPKDCKKSVIYEDEGRLRVSSFLFYHQEPADQLMKRIMRDTTFRTFRVPRGRGRYQTLRRRIGAYGCKYTTYEFLSTSLRADIWTPLMLEIKRDVERFTKQSYNFVLLNYYGDNEPQDEKYFGHLAPIPILSFGGKGKMIFKSSTSKLQTELDLDHGSLCVMWPPTNNTHEMTMKLQGKEARLSLTFQKLGPSHHYKV